MIGHCGSEANKNITKLIEHPSSLSVIIFVSPLQSLTSGHFGLLLPVVSLHIKVISLQVDLSLRDAAACLLASVEKISK